MDAIGGYLLDTHTLLWAVQEDGKLSSRAREIIENLNEKLFLSAISAFEIANKYRIGKLPNYANVAENYHDIVVKFGVMELPLSSAHAYFAAKLEWNHRDPFDRILAAQASIENLTLITNDAVFASLPWIRTLW
ncbi:MAG: type II toxin-antitoxin system VapC family toxin [Clostridiales Family XIII bacterium]|jgi:PIN domain nuclease of toxin-antitoxin system|nr:type II toxin-antitoxin system VapC family toxin [Clostridiales Family XIII bacterium]